MRAPLSVWTALPTAGVAEAPTCGVIIDPSMRRGVTAWWEIPARRVNRETGKKGYVTDVVTREPMKWEIVTSGVVRAKESGM